MSEKSMADNPDSPRGNIVEDFKYFFKETIIDSYNIKRHPIMAPIMYLLSLASVILTVISIYIIMQYYK